jgi:putative ABC transport system substrate-binding protein
MRWTALVALSLVLGLCTKPTLSTAAEPSRLPHVYEIGVLGAGKQEYAVEPMKVLRAAMADLGWSVGRIHYIERWANRQDERLPAIATELVSLKVDVIVALDSSSVRAAMRATDRIPIVFPLAWDPVAEHLVASLSHPAGNVTGVSAMAPELYAKELGLLKEAMPTLRRVGVITDSTNPSAGEMVKALQTAGAQLGIELNFIDIRGSGGLVAHLDQVVPVGIEALTGFVTHPEAKEQCMRFAIENRLPLVGYADEPPGLLSLEIDEMKMFRRGASYIDKILRGSRPSELPVEQPMEFRFTINVKTANALGLTIPESLLIRANDVIR